MTKLTIGIKGDNAAFTGGLAGAEFARILRDAAHAVEEGIGQLGLYDINGNRVGQLLIEYED